VIYLIGVFLTMKVLTLLLLLFPICYSFVIHSLSIEILPVDQDDKLSIYGRSPLELWLYSTQEHSRLMIWHMMMHYKLLIDLIIPYHFTSHLFIESHYTLVSVYINSTLVNQELIPMTTNSSSPSDIK